MAALVNDPPRRPKRERKLNGSTDDVPKALQLRSFERNFDVEAFVSDLSDSLIAASKSNTGPLDPIPFVQTFSPALDHLLELRKQLSEKTEVLEKEVRGAEVEYSGRLNELNGGFESIGSSFTALETKITGVGKVAVRIGEQLESLHHARSVAQSTSLLLSYYLSLSQPPAPPTLSPDGSGQTIPAPTPLDTLFATRTSRDGRARLAIILRRLTVLSKDVADNAEGAVRSAEGEKTEEGASGKERKAGLNRLKAEEEKAQRIRDEVGRYSERFEKECLRLFDKSYRKGDVRMMAHCAKVLLDFNGGTSCVQLYVNQHDFFIAKDRVLEEAQKAADEEAAAGVAGIWQTISKPDAAPPTSEPGLEALFKEIRVTVSQEAQIIQAVFPMKQEVMRVFLQRVFAQVIQQHLEQLFSKAETMGPLALLRMLRLAHNSCSSLVEDLKQYDMADGVPPPSADTDDIASAGVGTKQVARVSAVATVLDQCMEEICMPYLEGNRYIELETRWLRQGYQNLLSRYSKGHEDLLKGKPSLLDRVVNLATGENKPTAGNHGAVANAAQNAAHAAQSAAANFLNRMGPNTGGSSGSHGGPGVATSSPNPSGRQDVVEETYTEADRMLRIETAEQMLRWHAEAIGRMIQLVPTAEVPKNTAILARLITDIISRAYLEVSLDSSLSKLDVPENRKEVDLTPLISLQQVDNIAFLWQKYANTALLPLIGSAISIRKDFVKANSDSVAKIERKVDMVMQRTIDGVLGWLTNQLRNQKSNDYRPKNDDISFARNTTEPCQAVCEYMERLKDAGLRGLNGKNREAFFTEVAVAFHSLLLEHYKKFPVNPTGGLMLTKDLAAYQGIFQSLNVPAINDRFDMLRQLGNSFIVQPEVLKSYMTESYLGKIDARLLRPYLMQRSDWSSFSRKFNEELGTDIGGESGEGAKGQISRLSMGAGKLRELARSIDSFADPTPASSARNSGAGTAPLRIPGNRASMQPPPLVVRH